MIEETDYKESWNEVLEILKGIDKTEAENKDGWWETSTGAEFGKSKLQKLKYLWLTSRHHSER